MPRDYPGEWSIRDSDVLEHISEFGGLGRARVMEPCDFDIEDPACRSLPDDLQDDIRQESRKRRDAFSALHGKRRPKKATDG